MNEVTSIVPVTGGGASVRIYAADAVITIDPNVSLLGAADELAGDQIGLVVLGTITTSRPSCPNAMW